jgi:hypothetical protein
MAPVNAGTVVQLLIQDGPEIIAIGEAVAADIPKIAGLFKRTTAPDGTELTPDQIAALVTDTEAVDDQVQRTADTEIANAEKQLEADGASTAAADKPAGS